MSETRRIIREVIQAQRDIAWLILLLNANQRSNLAAHDMVDRLDKRLEKLKS